MGNSECRPSEAPTGGDDRAVLAVLDDDPITRSMIARYFSGEGFAVHEAGSAAECRTVLKRSLIDVIFIDINLPDINGIVFAQEIRLNSSVGIVFVTQSDNEIDRVLGLESAGDDYVTKPINLRELMARTRALLRRRKLDRAQPPRAAVVTFSALVMDLTRRELASSSGVRIHLTRGEFDLLQHHRRDLRDIEYHEYQRQRQHRRRDGCERHLRSDVR